MSETKDDAPVERGHTHAANTGKVELTLEDLAILQPGLARLMLEIGNRFHRCYHAAMAHNVRLARFQLSEGTKLLRLCIVIRPQYEDDIVRFIGEDLDTLREAIESADDERFQSAFAAMTDNVNRLHEVWNHGYLVWKVPETPPGDLVLEPRPQD